MRTSVSISAEQGERLPTPRALSGLAREIGRGPGSGLGLVDRLLLRYRPRICPFHVLYAHVPAGGRVLDIGCGAGLWLLLLRRLGRIAGGTGIDVQEEKIETAKALTQPGDDLVFRRSGSDDPWPKGAGDCVTMIDVLHHVPRGQQGSFVQRLAGTGARKVIFKDIDPGARIKRLMNSVHDVVLSRQLPRYCKPEEVAGWLGEAGYRVTYRGRHDMWWYGHYVLVAVKEGQA